MMFLELPPMESLEIENEKWKITGFVFRTNIINNKKKGEKDENKL
jgi:hypothetical protein